MKDLRCFMVLAKYDGETEIDQASIIGLLKLCGAIYLSRTEARGYYNEETREYDWYVTGFIGFISPANYEKIDKMLSMTDIQYKLDYMDY